MKKKPIDVNEYAGVITKALERGVLLTAKEGDKLNSMVIGWGHIGRIWELPVFTAYVRDNRYTRKMLDANPEFTVNVPLGPMDRRIFTVCGTRSGRDLDKIREAGLTPVEPETISVPGLLECPLTLECRVIYREEQSLSRLPQEIQRRFYSVEPFDHISYYGQILAAYLLEA